MEVRMNNRGLVKHLEALNTKTRNLYYIAVQRSLSDLELAKLQTLWLEHGRLCEMLRQQHALHSMGKIFSETSKLFSSNYANALGQGVN
jgi:hypothetical protein